MTHGLISTNESLARMYTAHFDRIRNAGLLQDRVLGAWARKVEGIGQPLILGHESLAHALLRQDVRLPSVLYAPNAVLKSTEQGRIGLDGIIVRTDLAKEQAMATGGYDDSQVLVADVVDPSVADNRFDDYRRRKARLDVASDDPSRLERLRSDYGGIFTVGIVTSGSGHFPGAGYGVAGDSLSDKG